MADKNTSMLTYLQTRYVSTNGDLQTLTARWHAESANATDGQKAQKLLEKNASGDKS